MSDPEGQKYQRKELAFATKHYPKSLGLEEEQATFKNSVKTEWRWDPRISKQKFSQCLLRKRIKSNNWLTHTVKNKTSKKTNPENLGEFPTSFVGEQISTILWRINPNSLQGRRKHLELFLYIGRNNIPSCFFCFRFLIWESLRYFTFKYQGGNQLNSILNWINKYFIKSFKYYLSTFL